MVLASVKSHTSKFLLIQGLVIHREKNNIHVNLEERGDYSDTGSSLRKIRNLYTIRKSNLIVKKKTTQQNILIDIKYLASLLVLHKALPNQARSREVSLLQIPHLHSSRQNPYQKALSNIDKT